MEIKYSEGCYKIPDYGVPKTHSKVEANGYTVDTFMYDDGTFIAISIAPDNKCTLWSNKDFEVNESTNTIKIL